MWILISLGSFEFGIEKEGNCEFVPHGSRMIVYQGICLGETTTWNEINEIYITANRNVWSPTICIFMSNPTCFSIIIF